MGQALESGNVVRGALLLISSIILAALLTGINADQRPLTATAAQFLQSLDRRGRAGVGKSLPVDSSIFTQTDFPANSTITKTTTYLKFVRPITTTDQRFVTPNVRDRAEIAASWIEWNVVYGAAGGAPSTRGPLVLVDGVAAPVSVSETSVWGAHGISTIRVSPGHDALHVVELIWPYDRPMEIVGRRVSEDLIISGRMATARPANLLVAAGDSLTQGFAVDGMADQWPYLLARDIGYRLVNQGYAGRTLIASDGAVYGAENGTITTFMILANDVTAHTPLAAVTSRLNAFWAGFFAAHRAGKKAKLLMISQPWMEAGDGGVPVSPTGPEYRSAMKAAVAAAAASYPNLRYESGLDLTNGPGTTTDGTHFTSETSRQQFQPRVKAHLKSLGWLP